MTTAQVVETSVTVNNNSPIQDYVHPDDQTQPTFSLELTNTVDYSSHIITKKKTILSSAEQNNNPIMELQLL